MVVKIRDSLWKLLVLDGSEVLFLTVVVGEYSTGVFVASS